MCAYENHHFHIIISLNISLPCENASPGLSVVLLVQELLGEYRCKYDLGLFLL